MSVVLQDEYKYFLPSWRQEMKNSKIIKCPNYEASLKLVLATSIVILA